MSNNTVITWDSFAKVEFRYSAGRSSSPSSLVPDEPVELAFALKQNMCNVD